MKKSTITTIIVVVVLIIGAGIFFAMQGSQPTSDSSLVSTNAGSQSSVGAEELAILNQVSSINIKSDFFSSDLFLSLRDVTQAIQTTDKGRINPFAPVPGLPSPFSTQIPTSQPQTLLASTSQTKTSSAQTSQTKATQAQLLQSLLKSQGQASVHVQ